MSTKELIKTQNAAGDAATAPEKRVITAPSKAVMATNGSYVELPDNRFELYDTQDLAQKMTFFPPNPSGDLSENNYDQMPPNPSQATMIVGLGLEATTFAIRDYGGGGTAANAIKAQAILDALKAGVLIVQQTGGRKNLVETPLSRFFDFSNASVAFDSGDVIVTLPSSQKITMLEEAVYVPAGVGYRVQVDLGSGAEIPIAAGYAASGQTPIRIRCRAEHRGNRGDL